MLYFLRKVRRSLIESGFTDKYMLHAIGEIALVVIGILIALQINNWNDFRNNRAEEQQILRGLQDEFQMNLNGLDYHLNITNDLVAGMWLFMSHITQSDSQYSITELDQGLSASLWAGTWDPANSVLDALISSGRLDLILNRDLRIQLAGWTSIVDEVRDNQVTIRNHCSTALWSGLARNGIPNIRGWGTQQNELHQISPEALSEVRYRNIRGNLEVVDLISMKYTWTEHSIWEIEMAIRKATEILSLIDQNLK